ncbi:diguanylate cyclase domain-containing protein [Deinococcus sp.]|uniref:GGDEF domain-containing protein n=1 Tax=Deinococcus sp. TaxID=47478 RepID=UPI003CC57797
MLALSVLGPVALLMFNEFQATPDSTIRLTSPLFLLIQVGLIWWIITGRSVAAAERFALYACTALALLRSLSIPLTAPDQIAFASANMCWALVIAALLATMLLRWLQAIVFSGALYLFCAGMPWVWLAVHRPPGLDLVIQDQILCGLALVVSWSVSWYREQFYWMYERSVQAERLAQTDALTGLPNRHALYPLLGNLVTSTEGGALILFDVDHFKSVNDKHGHNVGDDVLRTLAHLISGHLQKGEVLGRWGGEELLMVLPNTSEAPASTLADAIRRAVASHTFEEIASVTLSAGVAAWQPGESQREWLAQVDEALYLAKALGRNRVCTVTQARSLLLNTAEKV